MSEEKKEEKPEQKKGGGGAGLLLGILLPALASAGAAFGAVKVTSKASAAPAEHNEHKKEVKPPGPTMALEPFMLNIPDANKRTHPMKLTIAVEFDAHTKEDIVKAYTPRIRDALLSYVRTMTYEDTTDHQHTEKMRSELLRRCQEAGAYGAEKILITDMVSQ